MGEPKQGVGKEQHTDSAADRKKDKCNQVFALVLHKRTYGGYKLVVDTENHGHGAAADTGNQHGAAYDHTFQGK